MGLVLGWTASPLNWEVRLLSFQCVYSLLSVHPHAVAPDMTQVTPLEPVIVGSTVNLVCEAMAGDPPISYSWTGPSGQAVSPGDTDGTISVMFSDSGDYGIYTCTATNEFGIENATVEVMLAGKRKGKRKGPLFLVLCNPNPKF